MSEEPGVLPEGIEVTPTGRIYVTSSATGDVHVGSVGSATMSTFARGSDVGRASALGVHADARGRVFVASPSGVDVYSPSGELLARRGAAADEVASTYLNDLVITSDAVYVTDSANALVWRMDLRGNVIGELRPWLRARELMPSFEPGWFYLNGIVASPDGSRLLVSAQGLGALIRVDTEAAASRVRRDGRQRLRQLRPRRDGARAATSSAASSTTARPTPGRASTSPDWTRSGAPAQWWPPRRTRASRHRRRWLPSGGRYLVVNSQLDTAPGSPPWTVVAVPDPLG